METSAQCALKWLFRFTLAAIAGFFFGRQLEPASFQSDDRSLLVRAAVTKSSSQPLPQQAELLHGDQFGRPASSAQMEKHTPIQSAFRVDNFGQAAARGSQSVNSRTITPSPNDTSSPLVSAGAASGATHSSRCNEDSIFDGVDQCEILCKAYENNDKGTNIKLDGKKEHVCQSFWYNYHKTLEHCRQDVISGRIKMLEFLCGKNGICHEKQPALSRPKTRGIVFTAKRNFWDLVMQTIQLIHKLPEERPLPEREVGISKASLPVEMMVDSEELREPCEQYFGPDIRCIVPKRPPVHLSTNYRSKPYGYKPMAVLESSFDEVLFLDQDVQPLHNPTWLFESCEFKRTGAIFMPDLFGHACAELKENMGQSGWPGHAMWALSGATWEPTWPKAQEFESGAFLVDKTRHLKSLKLSLFMTENPEVQKFVYGDKEAFKFAFLALGASYTLSSDRPTQMMRKRDDKHKLYHRIGELQRMMGVYMFTHHLARTLQVALYSKKNPANAHMPVIFAVSNHRNGKFAYSYCASGFSGWSNETLTNEKYLVKCFPGRGVKCDTFDDAESGLLLDAHNAIAFLHSNGV